ncbi:hypothetical protein SZ64_08265 [Erythrobacter sp. SG61-1L]|uniref:YrdB family protein n=1 Tax=Erythrobacter sp. SG61-1L TaxID=1603897 RepID=UPI0006C938FD|nr:YrdB family protein [Erythrobacter sp. SG61-1L]KPL68113.1 hypothetical protein SZ64_08265 [Erythrobacter sp. SG61-1L]
MLRAANAAMAALLELAALAGFSIFGWSLASALPLQLLSSIACAGAISLAWSRWAAPNSPHRLTGAALTAFRLTVFAGATAAIMALGHPVLAATFAGFALTHIALAAAIRAL